ncbi:hypothetical protein LTR37_010414 [Vermiconidia calcicola]|uniref:Uncharacterized protein n=1 Tax=Vermiconidia calcicola TaxID=1690605 RepID=A0ACC3N4W3_9PEZI|nr:hypothetical protein LTR37_010414 [Vermiconidia calcicola]
MDSLATKTMGNISMQMAELQGVTAFRVTVNPGGSWSQDLKQSAGTSSCQKGHVGFMLSGRLAVQMDDGNKEVFGQNDVFMVPPGHDAWCEGDRAAVFMEFSKGADYYTDRMK